MGCDIHLVIETKIKNKWVGVWHSGGPWYPRFDTARKEGPFETLKHRDYEFFGRIANVRGPGDLEPIGIPEDASDLSRAMLEEWAGDGHSESHMSLREFILHKLKGINTAPETMRQAMDGEDPVIKFLETEYYDVSEALEGSRVVFWFDN